MSLTPASQIRRRSLSPLTGGRSEALGSDNGAHPGKS